MEHQTFKVYVHGPAHQFYRILHQSLVLGMAHAGRNHGAASAFAAKRSIMELPLFELAVLIIKKF